MLRWLRFYIERLLFTRRGHFSFVAGMLYVIYSLVGDAATTGTPIAESYPITQDSSSGLIQTLEVAAVQTLADTLNFGTTLFVGILGGLSVLLLLDLYKHEMGLVIDVES